MSNNNNSSIISLARGLLLQYITSMSKIDLERYFVPMLMLRFRDYGNELDLIIRYPSHSRRNASLGVFYGRIIVIL
jgi:hypothetical protein